MKHGIIILLAAAALAGGCERKNRPAPTAGPPAKPKPALPPDDKQWSAEEIVAQPEAYMQWAQHRLDVQVEDRQKRLAAIGERLAWVRQRREGYLQDFRNAENVNHRMTEAMQRAEDEDRWPLSMAGQSFTREKAQDIVKWTAGYVQRHKPLLDDYNNAENRLVSATAELNRDVENLGQLRERLVLDMDRVKLNQGVEELTRLRDREQEISGYAKALANMADASATPLPPGDREALNPDVEKLIK